MKTKISILLSVLVLSGFFLTNGALGFEQTYTIWSDSSSQTQSKWFTDYYNRDGVVNNSLRVGGWGDHYISMIKIPVTMPPVPNRFLYKGATLNLYSYGSTRPTSMQKIFWLGPWSQNSISDHWDLLSNNTYGGSGQVSAPSTINGWYSMDISDEVWWWLMGIYPNYGIGLYPDNNDNRFNNFYSPSGPGGGLSLRPFITVQYEVIPDFKMPLPGNKGWKLTTECGGKTYDDQATVGDVNHTGHTYYSLDFSPSWIPLTGGVPQTATDVPVYASAGGVVLPGNYSDLNGNYVKIDHDYDGNPNTGYQTVYLHLKNSPMVNAGDRVRQGQQLGIMGNTGLSFGTHLHVTFYFQNDSGPNANGSGSIELDNALMEGGPLTNYKLGTTWRTDLSPNQWDLRYYPSTNTQ